MDGAMGPQGQGSLSGSQASPMSGLLASAQRGVRLEDRGLPADGNFQSQISGSLQQSAGAD